MTLTFELHVDSVKLNQHAKCLCQRSFSSKIIITVIVFTVLTPFVCLLTE